jgi:FtsZ-binding cell division protein ZapB
MNFFQRLFVRAAAWIAPPLGKLLRSTGGTIERAQAEISELRERNNIRRQQIQDEQQELREAIQMRAKRIEYARRIAEIKGGHRESVPF